LLLTDRFVLLNYPRTGSTFARNALRALYLRRGGAWKAALRRLGLTPTGIRELTLPIERTSAARREGRRSQHGAFSQIPREERRKIVVSITRHPLDRVVSGYELGFWRDHPPADPAVIRWRYPAFPDISFSEFLRMEVEFDTPNVLQGVPLRADVGPRTLHFVRFYAEDPDEALARLTDESIENGEFLRSLPELRFLHTENLADELSAFLQEIGFGAAETALLRRLPRLNVAGSRRNRPWADYFTAEEVADFRRRERLLFRKFPEYE